MAEWVAVIMAGGRGQRFWPLSTEERPKQFLDLEGCGRTLLQATFDRTVAAVGDRGRVLVMTGERHAPLVATQLPELSPDNLLVEPCGRDTAPAVALAALEVRNRFGNVVMGVFPADHRIVDGEAFRLSCCEGVELAAVSGGLVTFGIRPAYAATAYGYIQRGSAVLHGHRVDRFVEKPDLAQAQSIWTRPDYSWNSGMLLARVGELLSEIRVHAPGLYEPLVAAHESGTLRDVFPKLTPISFDYAVLEHTRLALMVEARFDWDDLGDWNALERLLEASIDAAPSAGNGATNVVLGQVRGRDQQGNSLYLDGDQDEVLVLVGIHDVVIVRRGGTTMLVSKDRVQDIKTVLRDERLANHV